MFTRRLQRSWPSIRTSLRLMLGNGEEIDKVLQTADGPVCHQPRILRKTAIFFAGSAVIFASAAWVTNRQEAYWWDKALQDHSHARNGRRCGSTRADGPLIIRMNDSLHRLRKWHQEHIVGLPRFVYRYASWIYRHTIWMHVQHHDAFRVFQLITGLHVGVLLAFLVPRCRPFLAKHAVHHGLSGRSYTYFTSGFIHMDLPHLALNSLFLYGLAFVGVMEYFGEQDGAHPQWTYAIPQVAAFWVISGAFSAYFPELISLIAFQRAIRSLPSSATLMSRTLKPWHPVPLLVSFGASGTVYAIAAVLFCSAAGEETMITVFNRDITWREAGAVYVTAEAARHLVAWTGAPGHLSGALFGAAYCRWGPGGWQWMRDHVGNRTTRYETNDRGERIRACINV